MFRFAFAVSLVVGSLGICACASPSGPSALSSGKQTPGPDLGQSARAISPGLMASASRDVTDVTLANAGWTCIPLDNGLTICGNPGQGLPPIPPAADGKATYDVMAFNTLDHAFVHHVKLLRPDLYNGQPCLGGDPWSLVGIIGYVECIIP